MGRTIQQEPVSAKTGYGVIRQINLKAGDYKLKVVNFDNSSSPSDFTVSSYAENRVDIQELQASLEN